jgi:hypothetical protein
MWAEGTQADDDGATRDYYNRAAKLEWDNFMGDWRDNAGTPQGEAAYATSTLVDDNTPGAHTWNVTSLVQAWLAGTPNQGFFLRQVSGSGPFDFYSREHPVADERPGLTVATDMGSFVLAAEADTYLDSSTYQGQGDRTTLRIGGYPTLVRFDLSTIPAGANVASATLQLFSYAEYGTSALDVGVFRVFHDPGVMPPVENGLANSYAGDVGVGGHPDVHVFTDFEIANWGDEYGGDPYATTLERVTTSAGFSAIDDTALRVTVPAGGNTGMNVGYEFADQLGSEPTEIY